MSNDDRSDETNQSAGHDPRHATDNENGSDGTESTGVDRAKVRPWAALDYRAARPQQSQWQDGGPPTGIPEAVTGQTTLNPADAPPDQRDQYEWLAKMNQGVGDSDRRGELHRGGIERDLGVIGSRLDASERQIDRTQWLLERIDLKADILTNGPVELAVLAVISLAIDEDRTRFAQYENAKAQSILRDTAFNRLIDDYELTKRDVRRVRQRVRETDVYESPNK